MHIFIFCLLLGLGAAAPVGPVNFEIIRRSLHAGFITGVVFGMGACLVDLTYLILLSAGILAFLKLPILLNVIGMLGALIIAWFGLQALTSNAHYTDKTVNSKPLALHIRDGYLMTLFNPYTILFWASVSTQIASLGGTHHGLLLGGTGVLLGTFGWVIFLNTLIHFSKRLIADKAMRWINIVGGILLIAMAVYGFIHSVLGLVQVN